MAGILKLFLEISIMASAMIGIVLIIRKFFSKKMSPAVMMVLWGMVLVRLCLPFTFTSPVNITDLLPEQAIVANASEEPAATDRQTTGDFSVAENSSSPEIRTQAAAREIPGPAVETPPVETGGFALSDIVENIPIWSVFAAIWITGFAATLCTSIRKAARFRKKLKFCKPVTDERILEFIKIHTRNTRIKKAISVLECDFVHAPAVLGYIRPCILIPSRFVKEMDRDSLNAILLHEIYHIRNHDILVKYIWLTAKGLHWFNPLVWLAYKWFEEDVELRRDQKVACKLNIDGALIYSRSLLEAARYTKQTTATPTLATTLFENKCKLKKRIFRLIKPQKRTKSAAVISALLAMVMAVACFTTACQPTPETEVVVNKNEGVLESAISASPAPTMGYEAPESWELEPFDAGDKLTVSVDAKVEMPDVNAFPVYEFVKGAYTQEQVDKIIDYFYGDQTLYNASQQLTKSELEERLVDAKRVHQEIKNGATNEAGNVKYEESEEDILEVIESLEQAIQTAPESNETEVSDGKLETAFIDDYQYERIFVTPDMSEKDTKNLLIRNAEGKEMISGIMLINGPRYYPTGADAVDRQADGISTAPEDAKRIVQDMLDGFGFDFMEAVTVEAGEVIESGEVVRDDLTGGYRVECLRRAGAFYVTTMLDGEYKDEIEKMDMTDEERAEAYAYIWPAEELYVYVDDGGVTAIEWHGYGEIASTINENVELLPFEDIKARFENAVAARYAWQQTASYDENGEFIEMVDVEQPKRDIKIERIALSMARIQVKDAPENWQLVPVWEFYGTISYYQDDGTVSDSGPRSLLVLNAVDGSTIM